MGNKISANIFPQFFKKLDISSENFHQEVNQKYIIRQVVSNSPEHYQESITSISKFKQYQNCHIVRLLDSHTLQAHHLCSVITHIYVLFEKPTSCLKDFLKRQLTLSEKINNKLLKTILIGSLKGLHFFQNEGLDIQTLNIQNMYIEEDSRGKITVKMFNPYFIESTYEQNGHQRNAIIDLGNILKEYINYEEHQSDLIHTIFQMSDGKMSIDTLDEKYLIHDRRKYRGRIKITKNASHRGKKQERSSIMSNGSSLLIDGGKDESQVIFKEFYENFDNSISQISFKTQPFMNQNSIDIDSSHQFPKKYVNSRAFKKTIRSQKSIQTCQSDPKINNPQIQIRKRCEMQKGSNQGQILLSSAKLVHSFIKEL